MAVIGAGPAGSVCACSALATSPRLRVALVDLEVFPRDKACGDAIRGDAATVLRELDLGAVFDGRPVVNRFIRTVPDTLAELDAEGELPGAGYYIVERKVFDNHLFEGALERGASDYSGHKLVDAAFDDSAGLWRLTLAGRSGGATEIRCRTLVGADGPASKVRRLAGIERQEEAHTGVALRAYARAEGLAAGTMRLDRLRTLLPGYGWTFPLTGGKVNIGVGLDAADYKRVGRRLESYLDEYVRYLNGAGVAIRELGDAMTHPLPLGSQAVPLVPRPALALIGDAAAMVNPFTGEGIYYGIWAGCALGHAVGRSVNRGDALQAALEGYARAYEERYREHMREFGNLRDIVRFWNCFA